LSHGSNTASATTGISGKTWLVTGAARGLGLCLTRHLAAHGARVLALSRKPGPLAGTSGVTQISYDQASETAILAAAAAVAGPVDYVIHNAALRGDTGGLGTLTAAHLSEVMQINVAGPLILTRALLPVLAPDAALGFISSRAGSCTEGHDPDGDYAYCLSKAALNRAVAKLADDLPYFVLAIHPGWLRTDMGGQEAPEDPDRAAEKIVSLLARADRPKTGKIVDSIGVEILP
jgi:NAD(P)-dependent dehydrogenase (short-subunit alcohol dehydrogenase family)